MLKARITYNNQIVAANDLLELYPNYKELNFECLDLDCKVKMIPCCIVDASKRKSHFKRYKYLEHSKTCNYAVLSELEEKGLNTRLTQTELKKVGYPSRLILTENQENLEVVKDDLKDYSDEGITSFKSNTKREYTFDEENLKFNKANKVNAIDRIVDWYMGFPHNRDVEIEFLEKKTQYRYFFKKINKVHPEDLKEIKMFYGALKFNKNNLNAFKTEESEIKLEMLYNPEEQNFFYTLWLTKDSIGKHTWSRLKKKYEYLYEKAVSDFENKTKPSKNHFLYAFFIPNLNPDKPLVLQPIQKCITFRYDEVRKTVEETKSELFYQDTLF